MNRRPSPYLKSDAVFHNDFLELLEDAIRCHPDLTDEQKTAAITALYSDFYEVGKAQSVINPVPGYKPNYYSMFQANNEFDA